MNFLYPLGFSRFSINRIIVKQRSSTSSVLRLLQGLLQKRHDGNLFGVHDIQPRCYTRGCGWKSRGWSVVGAASAAVSVQRATVTVTFTRTAARDRAKPSTRPCVTLYIHTTCLYYGPSHGGMITGLALAGLNYFTTVLSVFRAHCNC